MPCVDWDGMTVASPMFDRRENRLLAALDPSDYALVAPHLSTACFSRGAILQEQGAPVAHVYFPVSGLVSLVSHMQDGQEIETAVANALQASGLIQYHRGKIVVPDRAALEDMACECYRTIRRADSVAPHCPHGNVEHSRQANDARPVGALAREPASVITPAVPAHPGAPLGSVQDFEH